MDLAVREDVQAVLIAGDLFDGNRLSFQTERFILEQARRLADRTAFFLDGKCLDIAVTEDLFTGEVTDERTRHYVEGRFG